MTIHPNLRRLVPERGPCYELFDLATALLFIAGPVYLLSTPSAGTRQTLSWLIGSSPQMFWGLILVAGATYGIICSYIPRMCRRGYGVIAAVTSLWSSVLTVGLMSEWLFGSGWQWAGLASAVLYGFFARQAAHQARAVDVRAIES